MNFINKVSNFLTIYRGSLHFTILGAKEIDVKCKIVKIKADLCIKSVKWSKKYLNSTFLAILRATTLGHTQNWCILIHPCYCWPFIHKCFALSRGGGSMGVAGASHLSLLRTVLRMAFATQKEGAFICKKHGAFLDFWGEGSSLYP